MKMVRFHRERKINPQVTVFFALACFSLLIGQFRLKSFYLASDPLFNKENLPPPSVLNPNKFQKAVHLIHTRFMQGQPNLVALGNSRLELFKAFCLPTMVKQTTTDFLWIILIDPQLTDVILEELQRLVEPYPHFILYKRVTQEIDLYDLKPSLVASGDKNLLLQAAYEAKSKILLQTRLDADDGLANVLLDQLQTTAVDTLQAPLDYPRGWMLMCIKKHFEWHFDAQHNETSYLEGWLRMSVTPTFCVTPGLTLAVAPHGETWLPHEMTHMYPHDRITRRFPRCSDTQRSECFHTLNEIRDPAAIRSRTPASSFMRGVGNTEKKSTPRHYWPIMEQMFTISRDDLIQTRNYLMSNVEAIAKENLESQCTGMNPCHDSNNERIAAIAFGNNQTDTGSQTQRFKKAVHIVYSRFMQGQPDMLSLGASRLELFKTFCLPTMVNQTTSDFLWLILADPFLHPSLMADLKRLVEPYPHFFIIRKIAEEIDLDNLVLSQVESGDKSILTRAAQEKESKILIETRLDADDGLSTELLEHIQDKAVETLQPPNAAAGNATGWMIVCVNLHLEWHYDLNNRNANHDPNGWLKLEDSPDFCVTPGLTLAVAPGGGNWTTRLSPVYPHDKIHSTFPRCSNETRSACFHTMSELTEPAAVRSRTPASSFMRGVGTTTKEKETPNELWQSLEKMFSIERKALAATIRHLLENVKSIAKDNLESHCTGINPCRDDRREKLSELASIG